MLRYTLGAGVTTTSFSVFVAPRAWCFQPRSSHVCETGVGARLRCSCTLSTQPVLKCTSDGIEHCTVFGGWLKGHVCIVVARDNSQLIHRAFSSRQKSFVPQYRIGSFPRAMALQHSFLPWYCNSLLILRGHTCCPARKALLFFSSKFKRVIRHGSTSEVNANLRFNVEIAISP